MRYSRATARRTLKEISARVIRVGFRVSRLREKGHKITLVNEQQFLEAVGRR